MVNWVTTFNGSAYMKASYAVLTLFFLTTLQANEAVDHARQLEKSGDVQSARSALAAAAQQAPNDVDALTEYAAFLLRYGDADSLSAYAKAFDALEKSGDRSKLVPVARELVILDLLAGDRTAANRHIDAYHAAGGKDWTNRTSWGPAEAGAETKERVVYVPGPLRSFGRMAAIASDTAPEDVLPALARNVVTNGYQASHSNEALEQTEYLKLVHRYLSQARELEKLAGDQKVIEVPNCDAPVVADLLRILGFRMRGGCGAEVVLETVNAARAFLTTDSGFPVNKLEEALRTNRPFRYDYHPAVVPVLFGPDYWTAGSKESSSFLETFIGDPAACRL